MAKLRLFLPVLLLEPSICRLDQSGCCLKVILLVSQCSSADEYSS
jgi:hypothetical protein